MAITLMLSQLLTLSGLPSILEINAEVSFKKLLGTELFETFVVIFKWGILLTRSTTNEKKFANV